MSLAQHFADYSSVGMYASVVCTDESIYDGTILKEAKSGLWFSVGGNPDRVIMFPWTSINRVVLKKAAEF
jgi:hypothetical protein